MDSCDSYGRSLQKKHSIDETDVYHPFRSCYVIE